MAHIRDADVKRIFTREKIPQLGKYLPDGSYILNGIVYCFEYENSSRGLMTHVAKYLKVASENTGTTFRIFLIRSQTHAEQHNQDYVLSKFLTTLATKNIRFVFKDCNVSIIKTLVLI
jgi:hypothetical protein